MRERRGDVFIFYRDTAQRRRLLEEGDLSNPERYCLYGLDVMRGEGWDISHNLEREYEYSTFLHHLAVLMNEILRKCRGYCGDFESVMRFRKEAGRASVVFSTADNMGIPLALFRYLGLLRAPVVHASIGLPERMERLGNSAMKQLYRKAFRKVDSFVAFGHGEAAWLEEWLRADGNRPRVHFVPFGVDTSYFKPEGQVGTDVDVLSVGADWQRDYDLLVEFARRNPRCSVKIVTSADHLSRMGDLPGNIDLMTDVPFGEIRTILSKARVVALPVKENTYSGATTTLLQAMAMAKPVVVSGVGAIRNGYGLEHGVNCMLVKPGDRGEFSRSTRHLLQQPRKAAGIGEEARAHVCRSLSWDRCLGRIERILEPFVLGRAQ